MSVGDENYTLKIEAAEVVKEIKFAVRNVRLSENLASTDELVFMNIETLEKQRLCVELSVGGFRVVGREYDTQNEVDGRYYETIYSLLDTVSSGYRNTFGDTLMKKLEGLQNMTLRQVDHGKI